MLTDEKDEVWRGVQIDSPLIPAKLNLTLKNKLKFFQVGLSADWP